MGSIGSIGRRAESKAKKAGVDRMELCRVYY